MSPAAEILAELHRAGVRLWLENGRLRYAAPPGVLGPEGLERLRRHRDGVLALLASHDAATPATGGAPGDRMRASFGQERMFYLWSLAPTSAVWTLPVALRLRGPLNADHLRQALATVVARHAPLRTTFAPGADGRPRPVIHEDSRLALPIEDVDEVSLRARLRAFFRRPFDLRQEKPLRAGLFRRAERDHVLALAVHHVAADGWSMGLIGAEVAAAYDAFEHGREPALPPLALEYVDYAAWQRARVSSPALAVSIDFWRSALEGWDGTLDLAADREPPALPSFEGDICEATLTDETWAALRALAEAERVTAFAVLVAVFQALLGRLSGQSRLVVGTPVAARTQAASERTVGFFANVVALPADMAGAPTFRELLRRTAAIASQALAHQEMPFDRVVEALRPDRHAGAEPLFNVMFAFQNAAGAPPRLHGLEVEALVPDVGIAHVDLFLNAWEEAGRLRLALEYSTDLWDRASMARLLAQLETLAQAAASQPDEPLASLPPSPPARPADTPSSRRKTSVRTDVLASGAMSDAPRDDVELRLGALWQQVLARPRVGRDEDFFASGGSSLSALQLLSLVNREFGRDLPLSALLTGSTVATFAAHLRHRGPATPRLVPFRTQEQGPTLVLAPPLGGTALLYRDIAVRLPPGLGVVAIQAKGLLAGETPHDDVAAMASEYVRDIADADPPGPLVLGGLSLGGLVAFEMAGRLQAAGRPPAALVLIDTPAPPPGGFGGPALAADDADFLIEILRVAEHVTGGSLDLGGEDLRNDDREVRLDATLRRLQTAGALPPGAGRGEVERLAAVYAAGLRAFFTYRPEAGWTGPTLVLKAGERVDGDGPVERYRAQPGPALGWERLCPQADVAAVPGNHLTLGVGANATPTARVLAEFVLRAREIASAPGEH